MFAGDKHHKGTHNRDHVRPRKAPNEGVHELGFSVKTELKLYWHGCKKSNIFKSCTLSVDGINKMVTLC